MYRVVVVIEKVDVTHSAYSPDMPGCVAMGKTRKEVERNMHDAIEMQVKGLIEDNQPVPESTAFSEYMVVK